jgi:hypothetical protein
MLAKNAIIPGSFIPESRCRRYVHRVKESG